MNENHTQKLIKLHLFIEQYFYVHFKHETF